MAEENTIPLDLGPPRQPIGPMVPPVSNMRQPIRKYQNETLGGATSSAEGTFAEEETANFTTPTREEAEQNEPSGKGNLHLLPIPQ